MGMPKPLLAWRGVTLIEYQIAQLLEAGVSEVVVVLGHRHEDVSGYVAGPGVRVVVNHDYRRGKTTSIIMGVTAAGPEAGDLLFLGVDQPCPSAVTRRLIEAHRRTEALITAPFNGGQRGHPNIFSGTLYGELVSVTDAGQGIREVIARHKDEVNAVEFDDDVVHLDLNMPLDYEEAKKRFGA